MIPSIKPRQKEIVEKVIATKAAMASVRTPKTSPKEKDKEIAKYTKDWTSIKPRA